MKCIRMITFFSILLSVEVSAQTVVKKGEAQADAVARTEIFKPKVKNIPIEASSRPYVEDKLLTVERYLNNITTLEAKFTQYSSNGVRSGKLYISKPHRIKWDYQAPKQALIVGSKNQFVYYDNELQEVSYIPSSKIPGFFLAHKDVELDKNIKVISRIEEDGNIFLDLQDEQMLKAGVVARIGLTLSPMRLFSIKIINYDQKAEVEVLLNSLQVNQPIDDEIFIFKDPNFFKLKGR